MLGRISTVTITTPDLRASTAAYQRYLGYRVTDDGAVGRDLARAWGRPPLAAARAVLMEPESGADTYLRFVEAPTYLDYQPFACLGWNAAELIVADIGELARELAGAPFHVIGPPDGLSPSGPVRSLQVVGPSREVLYLTQASSQPPVLDSPEAASFVDRVFTVILGGTSLEGLQDYYQQQHGLARAPVRPAVIPALSAQFGLPWDHLHPVAALRVPGQCCLEANEMPTGARPRPCQPGQLPPGVAMVGFEVDRLPEAVAGALGDIHRSTTLPYDGRRACACVGAAGELIELIEAG